MSRVTTRRGVPSLVSETARTSFLSFLLPETSSVKNFLSVLESFPSPMAVISSMAEAVEVNRWIAWSFNLCEKKCNRLPSARCALQ